MQTVPEPVSLDVQGSQGSDSTFHLPTRTSSSNSLFREGVIGRNIYAHLHHMHKMSACIVNE